jgi:hypothetical protein
MKPQNRQIWRSLPCLSGLRQIKLAENLAK